MFYIDFSHEIIYMTKLIYKLIKTTQNILLFGKTVFRKVTLLIMAIFWLAWLPLSVSATVISFTPTLVGGNQWIYNYTVASSVGDPAVDEFTVWYDQTLYTNLSVVASPVGWDPIVIQPDATIPADGFFDALALITGISPGTSQSGFAVSFDFLGNGAPGTQRFDIVDPNTFATLSTGLTSAASLPPIEVPEPNTLALAVLGLVLLLARRNHSTQI